jgi:hypothetical protein
MSQKNTRSIRVLTFFSVTLFSLFPREGQAGLSNQDLLKCCQSSSLEKKALCAAVLENTAQSIVFYRNLLDREDVYLDVCFPETLTTDDLIATYIAWIKERHELLQDAAFLGATSALSTAYSCKKKEFPKLQDAFKQPIPQGKK